MTIKIVSITCLFKNIQIFLSQVLSGIQIDVKQSFSKNMDLVNVVNGRTYREINISGRCTLCIAKCASFVFSFLILCSSAGNFMFKVNNRNTRTRCEICSNLTIKIPERCHYFTPYSSVSIVNFEHVIADWVIYGKIYDKYGLKRSLKP